MGNFAIEINEVRDPTGIEACYRIRHRVFVREQGVPVELEIDGQDPLCRHYLASANGDPLGAARMKELHDRLKLQRIAIMREARGTGLGAALVRRMVEDVRASGDQRPVVISSQVSAIGFYEKLGFVAEGEEYLDAGIPHRDMRLAR